MELIDYVSNLTHIMLPERALRPRLVGSGSSRAAVSSFDLLTRLEFWPCSKAGRPQGQVCGEVLPAAQAHADGAGRSNPGAGLDGGGHAGGPPGGRGGSESAAQAPPVHHHLAVCGNRDQGDPNPTLNPRDQGDPLPTAILLLMQIPPSDKNTLFLHLSWESASPPPIALAAKHRLLTDQACHGIANTFYVGEIEYVVHMHLWL